MDGVIGGLVMGCSIGKWAAVLYTAGLWTSFSLCSSRLCLLPITVSYISNATDERDDGNTVVPTLAFAAGLATAFTAFGVSASALGGVFGGSGGGGGGREDGGGGRTRSRWRSSTIWTSAIGEWGQK
jgi:predicted metal-binding membrane protein